MANTLLLALLAVLATVGCSGGPEVIEPAPTDGSRAVADAPGTATTAGSPDELRMIDPRKGGFEVGFGEWAVQLEADEIRPGPVTFVVRNGGMMLHGFEIEAEGADEGLKLETGLFGPGENVRIDADLAPGVYKIECKVEGHDDLGMEALLVVREGAPLAPSRATAPDEVRIDGFAFAPPTLEVTVGTEVTWTNHDPEIHTVTADDGSFDSEVLGSGAAFSTRFRQAGRFTYLCEIHPSMTGVVKVSA
jgi:plastocyanin